MQLDFSNNLGFSWRNGSDFTGTFTHLEIGALALGKVEVEPIPSHVL
jgi:hypothetical protein